MSFNFGKTKRTLPVNPSQNLNTLFKRLSSFRPLLPNSAGRIVAVAAPPAAARSRPSRRRAKAPRWFHRANRSELTPRHSSALVAASSSKALQWPSFPGTASPTLTHYRPFASLSRTSPQNVAPRARSGSDRGSREMTELGNYIKEALIAFNTEI